MYKGLVLSIVLVCLFSSGAFGLVGQAESFGLSAENLILLYGGGSTYGGNTGTIGQSQLAVDPSCGNTVILQSETGILNQGASAVGLSGTLGALQSAGVAGLQWQIADLGLIDQDQSLALILSEDLAKNDGNGAVVAGQGVVIGQVQITASPSGITGDAQFAGVAQFSGIGGGTGSTVSKDASVGASQ